LLSSSHRHGMLAERRVALQYEKQGFVVLDRNWRCRFGELDLVAANLSTLAVIEVKWRRSNDFGGPAGAVGSVKQSRIKAATESWLMSHPAWSQRDDVAIRFDVAAVTGGVIEVFEAAFE
jgi:putative endonuclease